jgi:hypothetical protein
MNTEGLLKNFSTYVEAKKKQALYLKLFFVATTSIVIAVLYFAYKVVDHAADKILVVNTGGELLPVESSEIEELYKVLLTTHCYSVSYYANSFDVNNIKGNQARAAFLVNAADLNAIFDKYQFDKAYSDVINKGVVYRCEFKKMTRIRNVGNGSEYEVSFSSILSVIDNSKTSIFEVRSHGTAIRVRPRYPENPTGFYFKSYTQEYYPIAQ